MTTFRYIDPTESDLVTYHYQLGMLDPTIDQTCNDEHDDIVAACIAAGMLEAV